MAHPVKVFKLEEYTKDKYKNIYMGKSLIYRLEPSQLLVRPTYKPLELYESKILIPAVLEREPYSHEPWNYVYCPAIVIEVSDYIEGDGIPNEKYYAVVKAGGLHNYWKFEGIIILSPIMKELYLRKFKKETYARMIELFGPDYYITTDGETYDSANVSDDKVLYYSTDEISEREVAKVGLETRYLLTRNLKPIPIGLVKGNNALQIKQHVEDLKRLGIKLFAFHTGDFLFRGNRSAIKKAACFARIVKDIGGWLLVYGVGSPKNFTRFGFADAFVTHSHLRNAIKHRTLIDGRWRRHCKMRPSKSLMNNLLLIEGKWERHCKMELSTASVMNNLRLLSLSLESSSKRQLTLYRFFRTEIVESQNVVTDVKAIA